MLQSSIYLSAEQLGISEVTRNGLISLLPKLRNNEIRVAMERPIALRQELDDKVCGCAYAHLIYMCEEQDHSAIQKDFGVVLGGQLVFEATLAGLFLPSGGRGGKTVIWANADNNTLHALIVFFLTTAEVSWTKAAELAACVRA